MISSLWSYRHFIKSSIVADFRGRFARSRLGLVWVILHPIAQSLIFAIVLAEVLGARMPQVAGKAAYPIYLLSGMAAWGLFAEILNRSMGIFIEHSSTLKKISFPRLCLPIIVWGTALINHAFLLLAIMVIFLFFGHIPGSACLALLLGALLISALAFGLGVFLGVINVFARDVAQVMSVVTQLWFWVTPIVYSKTIIPETYRVFIDLNPMTPLVGIYQDALLLNVWPSLSALWPSILVSAFAVVLSFVVFRRASPELVDAL